MRIRERFKMEHRDPRSAVVVGKDESTPASRTRDLPGLRIMTDRGWQLVGGPMKPAPAIEDQGEGKRMGKGKT